MWRFRYWEEYNDSGEPNVAGLEAVERILF